jgi:hypothetical protein
VSGALKGDHQSELLGRLKSGADIDIAQTHGQRIVTQAVDVGSQQNVFTGYASLPGNNSSGRWVIPSKHHHTYAGRVTLRYGSADIGSQRIDEANQAKPFMALLGRIDRRGAFAVIHTCHSEHTEPVRRHLRDKGQNADHNIRGQLAET